MYKGIEWLKEEVLGLRNNGNGETNQTAVEREIGRLQKWAWNNCVDRVYELINQLDEPEVLSQEWIDNNSINASHDGVTDEYVHVDDLENLLVPKQEEVKRVQIPEWIIEWYQGANNKYSTLEDVFSNLSHDTGYNIMDSEKFRSRIMEYGGFSKMYEALSHIYFGVYEIEEEQKYYVSSRDSAGFWFLSKNNDNEVVIGTNKAYYDRKWESLKLTEQEIKDYDSRYWTFAAKVEEVE